MLNHLLSEKDVRFVDAQKRSVFLKNGRRIGFAQARRAGLDVEALQARVNSLVRLAG